MQGDHLKSMIIFTERITFEPLLIPNFEKVLIHTRRTSKQKTKIFVFSNEHPYM